MPLDNTYNKDPPAAAQQRRGPPHSYPHPADAFHHHHRQPPPSGASQAEPLPCPRCDSNNTKFCYYNNYNLSQPRHFCKSCRRYWTHGGTLRNVPVGGGTRKSTSVSYRLNSSSSSNKRPRSSPPAVSPCSSSNALSGHEGPPGAKLLAAVSGAATWSADGVVRGSGFTSQLSTPNSNTFLALGGYGARYAQTLDGLGFGFGKGVWPFAEAGFIEGGMDGSFHLPMVVPAGIEAWHIGAGGGGGGGSGGDGEGGGGGGSTDGEGFAWPELAISMPGQGLK